MANKCEPVLGVVMSASQMRLTGLYQKVRWQESRTMDRGSWLLSTRSISRCLRSHTPEAERGNPVSSPGRGENLFVPLFPLKLRVDRAGTCRFVPECRIASTSREVGAVSVTAAHAGQANREEGPGRCGKGNWEKRRPVCNGSDTGSGFARRESELTSSRYLFARSLVEPFSRRNGDG